MRRALLEPPARQPCVGTPGSPEAPWAWEVEGRKGCLVKGPLEPPASARTPETLRRTWFPQGGGETSGYL